MKLAGLWNFKVDSVSRGQGLKCQPSESPINDNFTSLFIDYELYMHYIVLITLQRNSLSKGNTCAQGHLPGRQQSLIHTHVRLTSEFMCFLEPHSGSLKQQHTKRMLGYLICHNFYVCPFLNSIPPSDTFLLIFILYVHR